MKRFFVSSLILLLSFSSFSQTDPRSAARQMARAMLVYDIETYANFAYPPLTPANKPAFLKSTQLHFSNMEKSGSKVVNIMVGDASKIIHSGTTLQATLPIELETSIKQGKVISKSTLIGISSDNGKTWHFMDAGDKDIATLRKQYPELSEQLSIAAPVAAKFIPDDPNVKSLK